MLFISLAGTSITKLADLGKPTLAQSTAKYEPLTKYDPKFCENAHLMTWDLVDFGCDNKGKALDIVN